jgi:NAD-reducing hydrogenase large subunit
VKQGDNTIIIDPVPRIEGHSKIALHLNEEGRAEEARFHVAQFRGFENLCVGTLAVKSRCTQ